MPLSQAMMSQQVILMMIHFIALISMFYISNGFQVIFTYLELVGNSRAGVDSSLENYQCIGVQVLIFIMICKWFEILFRGVIRFIFTFWVKIGDFMKFTTVMTLPASFYIALYYFKLCLKQIEKK